MADPVSDFGQKLSVSNTAYDVNSNYVYPAVRVNDYILIDEFAIYSDQNMQAYGALQITLNGSILTSQGNASAEFTPGAVFNIRPSDHTRQVWVIHPNQQIRVQARVTQAVVGTVQAQFTGSRLKPDEFANYLKKYGW